MERPRWGFASRSLHRDSGGLDSRPKIGTPPAESVQCRRSGKNRLADRTGAIVPFLTAPRVRPGELKYGCHRVALQPDVCHNRQMNQAPRDIQQAELPNGVVIVTEKMPHVRSVSVGIWLGSGSRAESPGRNGIAHFIE